MWCLCPECPECWGHNSMTNSFPRCFFEARNILAVFVVEPKILTFVRSLPESWYSKWKRWNGLPHITASCEQCSYFLSSVWPAATQCLVRTMNCENRHISGIIRIANSPTGGGPLLMWQLDAIGKSLDWRTLLGDKLQKSLLCSHKFCLSIGQSCQGFGPKACAGPLLSKRNSTKAFLFESFTLFHLVV